MRHGEEAAKNRDRRKIARKSYICGEIDYFVHGDSLELAQRLVLRVCIANFVVLEHAPLSLPLGHFLRLDLQEGIYDVRVLPGAKGRGREA